QDFEQPIARQPMWWKGYGGDAPEYSNVHSGQHALRFFWNLRAATDPAADACGIYLWQPLPGKVQCVKAWVYTPQESIGASLDFVLMDASRRTMPQAVTLAQEGWKEYSFPVDQIGVAWPVRLDCFKIGVKDGKPGYIIIDDLGVETRGKPRDLLGCSINPRAIDLVMSAEPPVFTLTFTNPSPIPIEGINVKVGITDPATRKETFAKDFNLGPLVRGKDQRIRFDPGVKYGPFDIAWTSSDAEGRIGNLSGAESYGRMLGDAAVPREKPAERNYMMRWGLPGGVFWQYPPEQAVHLGAVWERFGAPLWGMLEYQPGRYDFTDLVREVDRRRSLGLDLVYFSGHYLGPSWYHFDNITYGPAVGRAYQATAKALGNRMDWYEFGNEENGPTKFLYAEYTRHEAAAVRSANPMANLGTAGTAFVDVGWMRLQEKRGLLDRLDALVTHPYTVSSSPEDFGIPEQLSAIEDVIDDLGGMKWQITTEFGYDHSVGYDKMAKWLPRHFALAAAAGILKHGLYSWEGHFGIMDNMRTLPPGISVHAFCTLTEGRQFAGWLRNDKETRAAVFERAGMPLVMAWSQSEKGSLRVEDSAQKVVIRDLDGNPTEQSLANGRLDLELTGKPLYIQGFSTGITLAAWNHAAELANQRYKRLLAKSRLKGSPVWDDLAQVSAPPYRQLANALENWHPASAPVPLTEQAIIAQTIRRTLIAARMQALAGANSDYAGDNGAAARRKWAERLERSVLQDDVDMPPLRWLLTAWQKTADERAMLLEQGHKTFAAGLLDLDRVFDRVCQTLADDGQHLFFPVWPYLFAGTNADGSLLEHIKFVPGKPVPVNVRMYSYASKSYEGEVGFDLPMGWVCEPRSWKGTLEPGKQVITSFKITANSTVPSKILATLNVAGKPAARVPYDDFELLPPFDVKAPVMTSILPGSPLNLEAINRGETVMSGRLRLIPHPGLPPLAVADVPDLKPLENKPLQLRLPQDTPVPPFNEWTLVANLLTPDGKSCNIPLTTDFSASVPAPDTLNIDGDLSEWSNAAPLHVDREEYTRGSYGGQWSKEDCSGTIYTMWDRAHFYLAARILDQTFQQSLEGGDTWNQDSIQIGLASTGQSPMTELTLALTPKGPQVWKAGKGLLQDARLALKVTAGQAAYELAVPWSEIDGIQPAISGRCRFDVLLNDHDAISSRKYLARYGIGIVNEKNPDLFGYLDFIVAPQKPSRPAADLDKVILLDDFEEYPDGQSPYTWRRVSHLPPVPESVVKSGVGRNGSKGLVLNNTVGSKPYVYLVLARLLEGLENGKSYLLKAWVKGPNTTGIGVASDLGGVEGFTYIPAWKPSNDWQQVQTTFKAGGSLNLIIRNDTKLDHLVIDDLEVVNSP
ncbi:MAG: hypothetical protein M1608_13240, partial [Candidatus Omnitrophica bacterium]|nr:hypothetical protein [Candidatus Omnitrophota bacterium]